MLGEKDISLFGRLKDKINSCSFVEFKSYISEKLEYIKDKIEPTKTRLLDTNKKTALNEGQSNIR